jgi:hypothetical protein
MKLHIIGDGYVSFCSNDDPPLAAFVFVIFSGMCAIFATRVGIFKLAAPANRMHRRARAARLLFSNNFAVLELLTLRWKIFMWGPVRRIPIRQMLTVPGINRRKLGLV